MNGLVVVIIGFVVIQTLWGMKRGFIRSVLTFLAMIVAMVAAYYCIPEVTTYLKEHTELAQSVREHVEEQFKESSWNDNIFGNLLEEASEELVTDAVMKILACLMGFFLIWLVLRIIIQAIMLLFDVPLLKQLNRLLGAAFGFLKSILWICVFFLLLSFADGMQQGGSVVSMIHENTALTYLYEHNPLLSLLSSFMVG